VAVSAVTGQGVAGLLAAIGALVDEDPEREFELAADDGEALAWLYQHGRVTARRETGDAVTITARLDSQALGRFEQLRPRGGLAPNPSPPP
jgi:GTP-binding protein HflX